MTGGSAACARSGVLGHASALTTDSPIGPLTIVRTGTALSGLYFDGHTPAPRPERLGIPDNEGFDEILGELAEYFDGKRRDFTIELAPVGTEFQQSVWKALRTIPFGERWTYTQLAHAVQRPTSVRAVAAANARNPISIFQPCHRVVGMNGSLTGFAGGLERKRFLLELEGA